MKKKPVTITDPSNAASVITLEQATQGGKGWYNEFPHPSHASTRPLRGNVVRNAIVTDFVEVLCDAGYTSEHLTENGLLFGSTSAPDSVIHDRGILPLDNVENTDDQQAQTVSVAWGTVPRPYKLCCDHQHWKLYCLHNKQIEMCKRGTASASRIEQEWGQLNGKCTCGEERKTENFDDGDYLSKRQIENEAKYITTLVTTKSAGIGGSMLHCDVAFGAAGLLIAGRKTVTVIDRAKTSDVTRIASGRVRLWGRARSNICLSCVACRSRESIGQLVRRCRTDHLCTDQC